MVIGNQLFENSFGKMSANAYKMALFTYFLLTHNGEEPSIPGSVKCSKIRLSENMSTMQIEYSKPAWDGNLIF